MQAASPRAARLTRSRPSDKLNRPLGRVHPKITHVTAACPYAPLLRSPSKFAPRHPTALLFLVRFRLEMFWRFLTALRPHIAAPRETPPGGGLSVYVPAGKRARGPRTHLYVHRYTTVYIPNDNER